MSIVISPWNSKNSLVTDKDIRDIYLRAGIDDPLIIHNIAHYQRAFNHKSYVKSKALDNFVKKGQNKDIRLEPKTDESILDLQEHSYENYEFLGDRVLDLSIAFYIHNRFPDSDEGFKTKLKTKIVNTDSLAILANALKLGDYILLSKHVEDNCDGRVNPRILEDVFESFICSIFLDQNNDSINEPMNLIGRGWQIANRFITHLIENNLDIEKMAVTDENYKDIVLRYFQHTFGITPKYIEIDIYGPPNNRIFTVGILDKYGAIVGEGVAKSKKKGEQIASKNALIHYGQLEVPVA
jgi:ribonuclease III